MKSRSLLFMFIALITIFLSSCVKHSSYYGNLPEGEQNSSNSDILSTPEGPIPNGSVAASSSYGATAGKNMAAEDERYLKADRNPPKIKELKSKCVQVNGQEVCGYDCKVEGNEAKCAQQPKARCVEGPHGIVCGFDCKVTATNAACGKYLYSNCATNAMGEIKCGNNCQEREDGALICGK